MDQTREEFIVQIRQAMADRNSVAYSEIYNFLVTCFVRADKNFDGQVEVSEFDSLIEEAAELPRRYGFAPTSQTMYSTEGARKSARAKQFLDMDTDGSGYITLSQWINFATTHITAKLARLPKDYLGGSADNVSKEEFITFIKKAVDLGTPEYRELYYFLLRTFEAGDVNKEGRVTPEAFDKMIEAAAAAPRRYGLAPKSSDMFKSDSARLAKRKEYFQSIDTNSDGYISFDEWLNYAYRHITGKVATL